MKVKAFTPCMDSGDEEPYMKHDQEHGGWIRIGDYRALAKSHAELVEAAEYAVAVMSGAFVGGALTAEMKLRTALANAKKVTP